jgi:hypothetical protein
MTSKHFEKLVRWFDQERELLRSKGIDDADLRVVWTPLCGGILPRLQMSAVCFCLFLVPRPIGGSS